MEEECQSNGSINGETERGPTSNTDRNLVSEEQEEEEEEESSDDHRTKRIKHAPILVLELYLKSNNSKETNIIHLSINNCIMCICNKNQQ